MPSLYSYCIPYDDGAAPNPYWGGCTLVICKPGIRRTAQVGDWIVGTGSKHARVDHKRTQDLSGRVVYAMKVTDKKTMAEYDAYTKAKLPEKIPDWESPEHRRRLGDSIYDYSTRSPKQRPGVHKRENMATDCRGKYALLSTHFYYFGDRAIPLEGRLIDIAQNRQGHRRHLNQGYFDEFVQWINGLGYTPGCLGEPLYDLFASKSACGACARVHAKDSKRDAEDLGDGQPPKKTTRRKPKC
jgi:Nucleotide modification associated domain 2